jgi:hypothetical protein
MQQRPTSGTAQRLPRVMQCHPAWNVYLGQREIRFPHWDYTVKQATISVEPKLRPVGDRVISLKPYDFASSCSTSVSSFIKERPGGSARHSSATSNGSSIALEFEILLKPPTTYLANVRVSGNSFTSQYPFSICAKYSPTKYVTRAPSHARCSSLIVCCCSH